MNGWMWRPAEAEARNRQAPRAKGAQTGAWNRPGRPAWANQPRPVLARFGPVSLPDAFGQLLTCSLMHVGPWYCLLHGLDRAPYRASFNIFCPGPWCFPASCFGPWALWSHVHEVSWLVSGFMIFSWSSWWTYPENILFNVNFLHKQQTPKSTCESELDTFDGLVPLVRTSNMCKCWWYTCS
jgi:hypothetical protein